MLQHQLHSGLPSTPSGGSPDDTPILERDALVTTLTPNCSQALNTRTKVWNSDSLVSPGGFEPYDRNPKYLNLLNFWIEKRVHGLTTARLHDERTAP